VTGGDHDARAAVLRALAGGDRRSTGRAGEIAAQALAEPSLIAVLVDALDHEDPVVRMRAADALEKATAAHPGLLAPYAARLLDVAERADQKEVRWHLAQLLPRLPLSELEVAQAARALRSYLADRSAIVRTFSLQALHDLSARHLALQAEVQSLLKTAAESGSAAERSRARRLLTRQAK
jgi:HEAT repeat protein